MACVLTFILTIFEKDLLLFPYWADIIKNSVPNYTYDRKSEVPENENGTEKIDQRKMHQIGG